jgi:hypothetical protein
MEAEPVLFVIDPVTEETYQSVLKEIQMHTIQRYLGRILRSLPQDLDPSIRAHIIQEVVANGPGSLHSC